MAPTRKNDPAKRGRAAAKANAPYNTRVNASRAVVKPYASVPAPLDESAAIEKPILNNASEFSLLEQPLAIIFVCKGDNTREVNIHKNLLIQHSPFFSAALEEGRFFEGHTQTVHLPEADPAYFSYVVEWIYQQKVGVEEQGDLIKVYLEEKVAQNPELKKWLENKEKNEVMEDTYYDYMDEVKEQLTEKALTYIEVWKLADFLSMPKLAKYIMRRLVNEYDPRKLQCEDGFNFLPLFSACYAHQGPIRKWIMRLFAAGLTDMRQDWMSFEESKGYIKDNHEFLHECQWYGTIEKEHAAQLSKQNLDATTAHIIQSENDLMLKEF